MPADESLKAWIALSLIHGLGSESTRHLLKEFGSPEAVLAAPPGRLRTFVHADIADAIGKGPAATELNDALAWLSDQQNHVITLGDSDYPQSLLNISDPPMLLYVKGRRDLLNANALAIVGSRNATPQGISNAETFARSLSEAGMCIISGLAHGIDAAAHRGALRGRGSSLAVVGTGLDKVYPAANRDLAHELAKTGTIVSEFPLGTPPVGSNFPRRNRLISGMSLGCLVAEASLRSGSLITARLAMEQGREVFAIPGSIHSPQSKGCHALIKQGAKLAESAQDILEELPIRLASVPINSGMDLTGGLPVSENADLLDLIGYDPVSMDVLCQRSGLTVSQLSAMLLALELEGVLAALPGGQFQRLK